MSEYALLVGEPEADDGVGAVHLWAIQGDENQYQLFPQSDPWALSPGTDVMGFGEVVALNQGQRRVDASQTVWEGVAAIGAPESVILGVQNAGVVSLYELQIDVTEGVEPRIVGSEPLEPDQLTVYPLSPGARFGAAIAMGVDGLKLVVGAPGEYDGAGAVYVYSRSVGQPFCETTPVRLTVIGSLGFGSAVSLDGDQLVVGAPDSDTQRGQSIFSIFHRASLG